MAQAKFKEGDRVIYHPTGAGNESIGTIKQVLKEPPMANLPSQDYPRYLIENESTKKETVYKTESIIKKFQ